MNGPDTWCYDALELPRVFANGSAAKVILRTLEVVETFFDSNPAMHATILLSRVRIEEYLATAPETDEVARYLREHRRPGQTTMLELESDQPITLWTIDGAAPSGIPASVPGDHFAPLVDETARVPRQLRAVVSPGTHVVRCERDSKIPYERTIDVEAGLTCTLHLA